ncbi:MAG: MurT ligase domain-containing protein [Acidimicrobiales bacterium]
MTFRLSARARVAVLALVSVNWLSRVTGRGAGTVAGGRVGLRVCPDLLEQLSRRREIICVSGTNGKTTTTALICAGWGVKVATNATGANMPAGHVAALAATRATRVVLEVDEAWLPEVIRRCSPRVVVLLNLSRDQLDRASEVRVLADKWRGALARTTALVVANVNDPLVVFAAETASRVRWCDVPTTWLGDAQSCPHCTRPLSPEGSTWHCLCGFTRPVAATTRLDGEGLVVDGAPVGLTVSLLGDFNRANAAMAITALREVGVAAQEAAARMATVTSVAGRFSLRSYRGQVVRTLLAKNPAGFSALLDVIPPSPGEVWVAINARIADGRDPSWLYDVPFERLRGHRVRCFGDRKLDLATRLDYAGVEWRLDDGEIEVIDETLYLLANYTAFADVMEESTPC